MTGTTVGRYELLEKLGEGGMGVVYRARDVLLNRSAALKFLTTSGLNDDRKRRFLQEAQVASALTHPNIVTIYEVCVDPPHEFIAMEFVDGRPLETFIGQNGMPLRDVLNYSIQIAAALAGAHAAGIVHRDMKPANVIVTANGVAKVLDFGLAKLMERTATAADDNTRTVALASSPHTVEGSILGTVAYMSPEQAEGKPVDHRSDIFSFGAMLYEMFTGKRAFTGDSAVSTLASVLRAEPADVTTHLPDLPRECNRIVRRCLEKSPDRRWQSMADVRAVLEDLQQDLQSGSFQRLAATQAATAETPSRRPWIPVLAAIAAVGAAVFAWLFFSSKPAAPPDIYTFRRITSDTASNVSPAISPDGKLVAYSSDRAQNGSTDIWIQQIGGGEPVRLTSNLGLCHSPSFSPDGSRIVFHGGPDARGIYVVATFGGEPRRVADGRAPSFSPDGSQISYVGPHNHAMLVPAMGGTPREVPLKHDLILKPVWLPDGKRLLFSGRDPSIPEGSDWFVVSVDGGEEQPCHIATSLTGKFARAAPQFIAPDGVLIQIADQSANIFRVPFDSTRARVTGPPVPVTMAPGVSFWPSSSSDGSKLAFGHTANFNTNVWSFSLDSKTGAVTGSGHAVTTGLIDRMAPYPSADGKRIAYKAGDGNTQEIRMLDVASGRETRISETSSATPPIVSPDGTQIAYAVREKDDFSIYVAPASGGVPRRVCSACGRPVDWFTNGTRILFDKAAKNTEIGVLDLASSKTTIILRSKSDRIYTPRFAPGGRFLSFTAIKAGSEFRAYIVPLSDDRLIPEDQWAPLTTGAAQGEREPFWAPNGRFLYFLSDRDGFRCVWGVPVDPSTGRATGPAFGAHHLHAYRLSLLDFDDVADIGLSVAGNTMYMALRELQANIWLAERQTPSTKQ